VLISYGMAVISLGLLYAAGLVLGVHLEARAWLEMTGLLLLGLIPFAALGVFLGHVLTAESSGPAIGSLTALLALLGGTWLPLPDHGFLHSLGQDLPSYWLVQASRTATGGHAWPAHGWIVIAAWTAVAAALAARAYRRDTDRQ
jgi:ABC-2 type transport system permease protein